MVPEGWQTTRMGDIARFINGDRGKNYPSRSAFVRQGVPFVNAGHLKRGRIDYSGMNYIPQDVYDRLGGGKFHGADILFCLRGSLGKNALVSDGQHGAIASSLVIIRPTSAVNNKYLFQVLNSPIGQGMIKELDSGSAQPNLSARNVAKHEVLLPPLPEQRKIAAVLTAVDETIEKTTAVIEQLAVVKKAMMQELLTRGLPGRRTRFKQTELGEVPVGWEVVPLGTVARIADPNPSHRYPPDHEGGIPLVSTANFCSDDDFSFEKCQRVPATTYDEQHQRCQFEPSDVVFARKGRIGFARPYGTERKAFSHTVVLMKGGAVLRSEFLLWVVRSPFFLRYLERTMNSNSGVPTLGVKQLGAAPVPLPPTDQQHQIVKHLAAVSHRLNAERASYEQLVLAKSALVSVLLTGELRVTPEEDAA